MSDQSRTSGAEQSAAGAAQAKPAFKLWLVTGLAMLGGVGYGLLPLLRDPTGLTPYGAGEVIGRAIAFILFPLIVGVIGFYVSRRSVSVGNIATLIVVALVAAGQFAASARQRNREVMKEVSRANAAAKEAVEKETEQKGYMEKPAEFVDGAASRLDEAGKKMSGSDAKVAKAGAEFIRRMSVFSVPHNESVKAIVENDVFSPAGLTGAEEFDRRFKLVERFRSTNEAMLNFIKGAETEFGACLDAAGLPAGERAQTTRSFMKGMKQTLQLRIREEDAQMAASGKRYLDLLRKHLGHWQHNADAGVVFAESVPDADVEAFNAAADEIQAAGERQTELMKQVRSGNGSQDR